MNSFNFQVNLGGIIDILANHLYSEEKVFIRELLQNATDAILARQQQAINFKGRIQVDVVEASENAPAQIIFEDNGVGLTEQEIHQFLSSIGSSIKRKTDKFLKTQEDFIGQFGIGLLSCFMVTEEIILITRSIKSEQVFEWRGNEDGSYTLKPLSIDIEPGTRIYLKCKKGKESFFQKDRLIQLIKYYGNLLPYPIVFGDRAALINDGTAPFENAITTKKELLDYGKSEFDIDFLDCFPIHQKDLNGVIYILPHELNPSAKTPHKVYLKNMLVSEKAENILPSWAFFVKCIINTTTLRPTASRESFYEDEQLIQLRTELANSIISYLMQLSQEHPEKLYQLLRIHKNAIKALAIHDERFFQIIIPFLSFPSTIGQITLPEYEATSKEILYVSDLDEFRQIARVANAQNRGIINAGYVYDTKLLKKYRQLFPEKVLREINAEQFIQNFEDLLPEEEREVAAFIDYANLILREFHCVASVKKFHPKNIPTLYFMDSDTQFLRTAKKTKEFTNQLWGEIIEVVTEQNRYANNSRICFNYYHPLIHRLLKKNSLASNELPIKVLYVQALLLGHHPLNSKELGILSQGLIEMMLDY